MNAEQSAAQTNGNKVIKQNGHGHDSFLSDRARHMEIDGSEFSFHLRLAMRCHGSWGDVADEFSQRVAVT